jgi:hypothetical protein
MLGPVCRGSERALAFVPVGPLGPDDAIGLGVILRTPTVIAKHPCGEPNTAMATSMVDILTFALSVIGAGGGGAVIAYGLFKAFGAKWLDNHFAGRLQALKHAHDQEMAHLKLRIDGQLDRAVKLNQREFEVLPDIWGKITEAHEHALSLVSPMRRYPDFSKMDDKQRDETLAKSELSEWQKAELRTLGGFDQNTYYIKAIYWHELHSAKVASGKASDAVTKNGMFLSPDTFARLNKFCVEMFRAIQTHEINKEVGERKPDDEASTYRKQGQAAFEELSNFLRGRFWSS